MAFRGRRLFHDGLGRPSYKGDNGIRAQYKRRLSLRAPSPHEEIILRYNAHTWVDCKGRRTMRMAVLFLAAVLLAGGVCRVGGEEEKTPRSVLIPVPQDVDVDDATLQRLAEKYADEKQNFLKLLLVLEANQVDYSRDSLGDIKRKKTTILRATGQANAAVARRFNQPDLKVDLGNANRQNRNTLPGGSLCLERCIVTGYSMPYGAFVVGGKHLLIEDCLFDGTANRTGGHFLGMSNTWEAIYLRKTTIEEQRTMSHGMSCPLVLDRCQFKSDQPVMLFGNPILVRATSGLRPLPQLPQFSEFQFDTDDEEVVEYALGKRKEIDPRIQRLAEAIKLSRNPFYWVGLLRHRSQEIRVEAATQIQRLLGQQVDPKLLAAKEIPIVPEVKEATTAAIRNLKSDEYSTRERARKELIAIGQPAVDALRDIAKRGTLEQKRSAEVILLQIVGPPDQQPAPRGWDLEYGRISRWFEANRSKLAWDEAAGRYQ